jgi:opacity protein-like surface antigen
MEYINGFTRLLLFTFLLCLPHYLLAQFSVGLQVGNNLSKMDFTNNEDFRLTEIDNRQGFMGGIVVQFMGEKHAGVQAEINYSQRGWIVNDTTGDDFIKYKNRMDYLEMPILTHINIGGKKLRGLFNIGPYLGYALNRSTVTENVDTGEKESSKYTFNADSDNRFDFGLMVGAGMEYRLKKGKLAAELRYVVGLGDINKVKVYESELSQFRIISVLVRYTLPVAGSKPNPKKDVQ